MNLENGILAFEAGKANVEGWAGVVTGGLSTISGLLPFTIAQGISKGLGYLSISLGVGAVVDGCIAYRFDGLCRAEAISTWTMAPIGAQLASSTLTPGTAALGGLFSMGYSGVWLWAEQYRGLVPSY